MRKKQWILAGAVLAGVSLIGAALALLSDTQSDEKQTRVGTVAIESGPLLIEAYDAGSGLAENREEDTVVKEDGTSGTVELSNLNPGDQNPLEFPVKNTGTKSVQSISYLDVILTSLPADETDETIKEKAREFLGMINLLVEDTYGLYGTADSWADITDATLSDDGEDTLLPAFGICTLGGVQYYGMRYPLLTSLSGQAQTDTDASSAETEEDASGNALPSAYTWHLKAMLSSAAPYEMMNAAFSFRMQTEAVQYRNTSTDILTAAVVGEDNMWKEGLEFVPEPDQPFFQPKSS